MRRTAAGITLLNLALLAVLAGCGSTPEPGGVQGAGTPMPLETVPPAAGNPQPGGIVVISYGGGTPRHFNPALVSGSSTAIVGAQLFASPLRYDGEWNPRPYLAQSWEVADDGLAVTLHLVDGATFHDGVPITSEDVAFSVMTVRAHHPFQSMFVPVEQVETPDPLTAVLRLSRPHPALLLSMSPALLPILPKHVYGDGQDLATHPANLEPIGSGPFRLVEYVPDDSIVLERYDDFFVPGRPYLDGIVIRLETNPDAQAIDMQREEAHLLAIFTSLDALDRLGSSQHLVLTQRGYEGLGAINWLAFNLLRAPLDDKRVRQAIAYTVDPDFVVAHLHQGRTRRAKSPIAPDGPWYDASVPSYGADLDKAERLLDEAGYTLQPDGTRFSVTLDYIPVIPSQQRDVALYLERQLARVGIKVEVRRSTSFSEWAARIGNWDFDLTMDAVYNWGDPVIGVHRTYLCDNIRQGVVWSNTQNYCNPQVDGLLLQAGTALNQEARKGLYAEFQQIVTEELPVFWINTLPFHTVYHAGLGNPPLTIWGVHSALDELYWRDPPSRVYATLPSVGEDTPVLKQAAVAAMTLIRQRGLHDAAKVLRDPNWSGLDSGGQGVHVLGLTQEGILFLDSSGRLTPGLDVGGMLDLEGNRLVSQLVAAARGENGGFVKLSGVWPHPDSGGVGPAQAWCGLWSEGDLICAIGWVEEGGRGE